MYTIEKKQYGVKLTLHKSLNDQEMVTLTNDLKRELRGQSLAQPNEKIGVVVDMQTGSSLDDSIRQMIYVLDATQN